MDEVPFKQQLYNCMLEYHMIHMSISRAQVIIINYHIVGVNGTLETSHHPCNLALSGCIDSSVVHVGGFTVWRLGQFCDIHQH